ncbi:MAG: AMP-binding protein [Acidimicrobiia bacterium]
MGVEPAVISVCARLEAAADSRGTITFVGGAAGDARVDRVEWARLHEDARAMAAALQARGVAPGSHVAVVGPTSRALVTALQATWLAGGAVVALPLPMRLGSVEEFVEQTRRRIAHADVDIVVIDPDLAPFLDPPPTRVAVVRLDDLTAEANRLSAARLLRPADDPDRLTILQFTSGSTADPKGVMLPDRCIGANVDAIAGALGISAADRAVSWLPLYHDMGLIGLLMTPMLTGFELVLGAPTDFLSSPGIWLEWISEYRGTISAGPNFSYALAARALRRAHGLDLSSWRLALNGAEPVDPAAVEAFCAAAAPHGFDAKAAFPVFGMAEATLGVTFPDVGVGMEVDTVDRIALENERYAAPTSGGTADTRRLAMLGRPLVGFELRICDPESGDVLHDREVGELELRSPTITPGYYGNADATKAAFHGDWFRTGDLGYLVDGRLVVCGRLKDMIIVGGRNVFPEDIERAASTVEGVRAGNVIAFGSDRRRGRESIIVVAETRTADDTAPVRDAVVTTVCDAVGVPPVDVVLVRPGTLPKTSSGKLQRSLCRDRYHADELESV